jgi:acetyl esterase/lipase
MAIADRGEPLWSGSESPSHSFSCWGCSLLFVPFHWRPVGIYLFTEKALAVAYVPFIAAAAAAVVVVGAVYRSWWITVPAGLAAVGAIVVVAHVGSAPIDLAGVIGAGWEDRIPSRLRRQMVHKRWAGPIAKSPQPRLRQDVAFATVPGTGRVLLCDVWQPPVGVAPSGFAVVYLHGSGYVIFDKDFFTRALFRHLAAQGHVIIDVAYRLCPETGVPGMAADALRAVGWVRNHAGELGVDPYRIVLAGGSSGGHLALLAGYGPDAPALTPPELAGADLRVRAVASFYGQVGLDSMYWHCSQDKTCRPDDPQPDWTAQPSRMLVRLFGANAARLRLQFFSYGGHSNLLTGGTPVTVPERYEAASALTYVGAGCPPTLLMHGTHDEMAPVAPVRRLRARLEQAGVPVTAAYLPHTDHMFDLVPVVTGGPGRRLRLRAVPRGDRCHRAARHGSQVRRHR